MKISDYEATLNFLENLPFKSLDEFAQSKAPQWITEIKKYGNQSFKVTQGCRYLLGDAVDSTEFQWRTQTGSFGEQSILQYDNRTLLGGNLSLPSRSISVTHHGVTFEKYEFYPNEQCPPQLGYSDTASGEWYEKDGEAGWLIRGEGKEIAECRFKSLTELCRHLKTQGDKNANEAVIDEPSRPDWVPYFLIGTVLLAPFTSLASFSSTGLPRRQARSTASKPSSPSFLPLPFTQTVTDFFTSFLSLIDFAPGVINPLLTVWPVSVGSEVEPREIDEDRGFFETPSDEEEEKPADQSALNEQVADLTFQAGLRDPAAMYQLAVHHKNRDPLLGPFSREAHKHQELHYLRRAAAANHLPAMLPLFEHLFRHGDRAEAFELLKKAAMTSCSSQDQPFRLTAIFRLVTVFLDQLQTPHAASDRVRNYAIVFVKTTPKLHEIKANTLFLFLDEAGAWRYVLGILKPPYTVSLLNSADQWIQTDESATNIVRRYTGRLASVVPASLMNDLKLSGDKTQVKDLFVNHIVLAYERKQIQAVLSLNPFFISSFLDDSDPFLKAMALALLGRSYELQITIPESLLADVEADDEAVSFSESRTALFNYQAALLLLANETGPLKTTIEFWIARYLFNQLPEHASREKIQAVLAAIQLAHHDGSFDATRLFVECSTRYRRVLGLVSHAAFHQVIDPLTERLASHPYNPDLQACLIMADRSLFSEPKNLDLAYHYLSKIYQIGREDPVAWARACTLLAMMYQHGWGGVTVNLMEARRLYRQAKNTIPPDLRGWYGYSQLLKRFNPEAAREELHALIAFGSNDPGSSGRQVLPIAQCELARDLLYRKLPNVSSGPRQKLIFDEIKGLLMQASSGGNSQATHLLTRLIRAIDPRTGLLSPAILATLLQEAALPVRNVFLELSGGPLKSTGLFPPQKNTPRSAVSLDAQADDKRTLPSSTKSPLLKVLDDPAILPVSLSGDALYEEAMRHYHETLEMPDKNKFKYSINLLTDAAENKNNVPAMMQLARIFLHLGNVEAARHYWILAAEQHYLPAFLRFMQHVAMDDAALIACFHGQRDFLMADASPDAQYLLGVYYEFIVNPHDLETAKRYYEKAADAGSREAQYRVAELLAKSGDPGDQKARSSYLKSSAAQHYAPALSRLGDLEREEGEYKTAVTAYEEAVRYGDPQAALQLGLAYKTGQLGLPVDIALALHWFAEARRLGDLKGDYEMIVLYVNGYLDDLPASGNEAMTRLRQLKDKDFLPAEVLWNQCLLQGIGLLAQPSEAVKALQTMIAPVFGKSSQPNEPLIDATFLLIKVFFEGKKIPAEQGYSVFKRPEKAVSLLRWLEPWSLKAALDLAKYLLLYEKDHSAHEEATQLLDRVIDGKELAIIPEAEYYLSTKRTGSEKVTWLRSAANHGFPLAQLTLGELCFTGEVGVAIDPKEGIARIRSANVPLLVQTAFLIEIGAIGFYTGDADLLEAPFPEATLAFGLCLSQLKEQDSADFKLPQLEGLPERAITNLKKLQTLVADPKRVDNLINTCLKIAMGAELADAFYEVALRYLSGKDGFPVEKKSARLFLKKAAYHATEPNAQALLKLLLITEEPSEALLERGLAFDLPQAKIIRAKRLIQAGSDDKATIRRFLEETAEQGSPEGQFELSQYLSQQVVYVDHESSDALQARIETLLHHSAEQVWPLDVVDVFAEMRMRLALSEYLFSQGLTERSEGFLEQALQKESTYEVDGASFAGRPSLVFAARFYRDELLAVEQEDFVVDQLHLVEACDENALSEYPLTSRVHQCFKTGAERGFPGAMFVCAKRAFEGNEGFETITSEKATDYLEGAINVGSLEATAYRGACYSEGKHGYLHDLAKAKADFGVVLDALPFPQEGDEAQEEDLTDTKIALRDDTAYAYASLCMNHGAVEEGLFYYYQAARMGHSLAQYHWAIHQLQPILQRSTASEAADAANEENPNIPKAVDFLIKLTQINFLDSPDELSSELQQAISRACEAVSLLYQQGRGGLTQSKENAKAYRDLKKQLEISVSEISSSEGSSSSTDELSSTDRKREDEGDDSVREKNYQRDLELVGKNKQSFFYVPELEIPPVGSVSSSKKGTFMHGS